MQRGLKDGTGTVLCEFLSQVSDYVTHSTIYTNEELVLYSKVGFFFCYLPSKCLCNNQRRKCSFHILLVILNVLPVKCPKDGCQK